MIPKPATGDMGRGTSLAQSPPQHARAMPVPKPLARHTTTAPDRATRGVGGEAPYLDLRGGAGAFGAEEAVGRGGANGVGAGVPRLVGAAVPHHAAHPSVAR
jgi:hypothetical protein